MSQEGQTIAPCDFIQALVDEQPNYDKYIVEDLRPTDGEIGHISIGEFPAFSGVNLFQDRFNHVAVNTTRPWKRVSYESCVGRPCCKSENQTGVGSTRLNYYLEEISYSTPLLCFDQQLHVTHAVEQWNYIISDILKPIPSGVQSMWIRKRGLQWAKHRFVANANFGTPVSEFNYTWANDVNGNEVYLLTSAMPTSKLTPQMLQRRVGPLTRIGYHGKDPYKEEKNLPMIELVTGEHTLWDLEHLSGQPGGSGSPTLPNNWRFTEWDAASKFWRYGFTGQLGEFMVRVDTFEMRFIYLGASGNATYPFKFQLVLPYVNITSSGAGGAMGLKSEDNPDYETAPYRFTRVWHKEAMQALVQDTAKINAMMPYAVRDFGGKWKVVLPHVLVDENGVVTPIDNRRENQCQFLMDLQMAIRPNHTEWMEWYFHIAEPSCVTVVEPCSMGPCYPPAREGEACPQHYLAHNWPCPTPVTPFTFTPTLDSVTGSYNLEANTVLCDLAPISHGIITATTIADLVTQLNAQLANLGVWAVASPTTITLTGSNCATVTLPWTVTTA